MTYYNAAIRDIPLPARMRKLPISDRGFPVPWFVSWPDGAPEFRAVEPRKIAEAINRRKCWICGETTGSHLVFAIGPMCAISRTTSEPPAHRDCAEYAVRACPFLVNPRARRNDKDLPEERFDPAGVMIRRNPGVTALWFTRGFRTFHAHAGNPGVLIRVDPAERVDWYCEGRAATRAEVLASIDSGMPLLLAQAQAQGAGAVRQLEIDRGEFARLLPREQVSA